MDSYSAECNAIVQFSIQKFRFRPKWFNLKYRNELSSEWLDLDTFVRDVQSLPEGQYLGRKDVSKPYGKDNFCFVKKPQFPKFVTHKGIRKNLSDWGLHLDISHERVIRMHTSGTLIAYLDKHKCVS